MTAEELKIRRRQLGLNQTQMAAALKLARRTYVNYERGVRPIPGLMEVALEGLLAKDRQFMARIGQP